MPVTSSKCTSYYMGRWCYMVSSIMALTMSFLFFFNALMARVRPTLACCITSSTSFFYSGFINSFSIITIFLSSRNRSWSFGSNWSLLLKLFSSGQLSLLRQVLEFGFSKHDIGIRNRIFHYIRIINDKEDVFGFTDSHSTNAETTFKPNFERAFRAFF